MFVPPDFNHDRFKEEEKARAEQTKRLNAMWDNGPTPDQMPMVYMDRWEQLKKEEKTLTARIILRTTNSESLDKEPPGLVAPHDFDPAHQYNVDTEDDGA